MKNSLVSSLTFLLLYYSTYVKPEDKLPLHSPFSTLCLKEYCKIATFWAICKNSVQRFHRSVQPFHTFLEIARKVSNIASEKTFKGKKVKK
nr:MAG TPA: hypothetical protein [Caudoviricetes sp.]